jgi:hypothetical protein
MAIEAAIVLSFTGNPFCELRVNQKVKGPGAVALYLMKAA